jgi:hypothetical protein
MPLSVERSFDRLEIASRRERQPARLEGPLGAG